jgi:hypothetical protein
MNNKSRFFWVTLLVGSVLAGYSASVFSFSGESHWLEVRVFDKQSARAVSGAAVCLGTTARPDQFGAVRSNQDGVVRFENLSQMPMPLLATVSKQGFQGRKQLLESVYQSRVLVMKIASGGGGPECHAPAEPLGNTASSGLTVDRIDISADSATGESGNVLISVTASGPVNQIRISEQADFSGASWQPYQPAVAYNLSEGKGLKQIHVQVRRFSEAKGASIEVLSLPKKARYRLQ